MVLKFGHPYYTYLKKKNLHNQIIKWTNKTVYIKCKVRIVIYECPKKVYISTKGPSILRILGLEFILFRNCNSLKHNQIKRYVTKSQLVELCSIIKTT